MIESDGLQPFTMEALARTASVSSPLVYNYFSSRLALSREQLAMSREVAAKRLEAENFESIIRVFVETNPPPGLPSPRPLI